MLRACEMTWNTDGVSSVQLCFWATTTAVELTLIVLVLVAEAEEALGPRCRRRWHGLGM
jgi:hypothetical protein